LVIFIKKKKKKNPEALDTIIRVFKILNNNNNNNKNKIFMLEIKTQKKKFRRDYCVK